MHIDMPAGASEVISKLTSHGYEAYIVGGCVRDALLGVEPEDWDITTSAKPDEIKKLFRRTVDTGIEHGTVTVLIGKETYEVTTYRMDGAYEDHRHPSEVIFTPDLKEDLMRRDFTINAMAYNDEAGLVDLYNGQDDLKNKIIRCVGDPYQRFDEDALRMLRGIRFAGQLLFDIEEETYKAISKLAPTLVNISAERIRVELTKLLISKGADRLRLAYETGLTAICLPEFDEMMRCEQNSPHHCYTVGEHSLKVVTETLRITDEQNFNDKNKKIALVFAALLHDVAKPECKRAGDDGLDHFHGHDVAGEEMAGRIMRRLKFDNDTRTLVKCLARYHDVRYDYCLPADGDDGSETASGTPTKGKRALRRLMNKVGRDRMPILFILQRADILGQSDYRRKEKIAVLDAGMRCYEEVCSASDAVNVSELAISGSDLIKEKGFSTGPAIGKELRRLLEMVMDEPELNTREKLLELVKK